MVFIEFLENLAAKLIFAKDYFVVLSHNNLKNFDETLQLFEKQRFIVFCAGNYFRY